MSIIRQALEMNKAVYEMFFSVSDGAISSQELADSTNEAMELNKNALIELSRLETMQKVVVKDWCNIDFNSLSAPGTLQRISEAPTLEEQIRQKRHMLIGKAIMKMNRWQRIWWAITGHHEYMTYKYWEGK